MKSLSKKDYNILLELLYQLRISSGLRQADIADKLKVPQSFISKLESGERRLGVLEFVIYCKCLNANPADIFSQLVNRINEGKSKVPKPRK